MISLFIRKSTTIYTFIYATNHTLKSSLYHVSVHVDGEMSNCFFEYSQIRWKHICVLAPNV